MLLFGWSGIEGLGAALVIPAIVALIAANYQAKERAFAYGLIGGAAGAASRPGRSSAASDDDLLGGRSSRARSWS